MEFRKINNPSRVSPDFVKKLAQTSAPGSYLAQDKWDGWRRPCMKIDGCWFFSNKGGEQARKEMPPDLTRELYELFKNVDNIGIDAEWIGPRNKDAIDSVLGRDWNGLVLHDLHWMNGTWAGNQPAKARFANLTTLFALAQAARPSPSIQLVRCWDHDWDKLFEESKKNPLLEGIVLKDADSLLGYPWLKGDDNIGWHKCKWRDIHEPSRV